MRSISLVPDINIDMGRLNISYAFGESILAENNILTAKYRLKKEQKNGLTYFSNKGLCIQLANVEDYIFIMTNSSQYYYQKKWLLSIGFGFDFINYTDLDDSFSLFSPRFLFDINNPLNSMDISLQFIKYGISF